MPNSEITRDQVNEWVRALRSGDYKQTTGALATITGFNDGVCQAAHCCLGVYGVLNGGEIGEHGGLNGLSDFNENSFVPSSMMTTGAQHLFSELNDALHLNFQQIANVVQWLPLTAFQDASWWVENADKMYDFKKGLTIGSTNNG
jgi:hypothetical protein